MSTDPNQPTTPATPDPGTTPAPTPTDPNQPTTPDPGTPPAPGTPTDPTQPTDPNQPGTPTDPGAPTTPPPGTGSLPTPDPAAGTAANQEAGMARQDVQRALRDGTIDLRGLFDQGSQPGPVGHMNIKAALIALPHIDEVRATQILTAAGIDPGHNIDQIGVQQQETLLTAVEQFQ